MRQQIWALVLLFLSSHTAIAAGDAPPDFYGPGIGWLKAICDDKGNGSQGACIGAIWTIAQRLEQEKKICMPTEVTGVFSEAQAALNAAVKAGLNELATPYYDVIATTLTLQFGCNGQ